MLVCDASQCGIGAVLSHVTEDQQERPITYALRTFTMAEENYLQLEKEVLSIIFAVEKFTNCICRHVDALQTLGQMTLTMISSYLTGISAATPTATPTHAVPTAAPVQPAPVRRSKRHCPPLDRLACSGNCSSYLVSECPAMRSGRQGWSNVFVCCGCSLTDDLPSVVWPAGLVACVRVLRLLPD